MRSTCIVLIQLITLLLTLLLFYGNVHCEVQIESDPTSSESSATSTSTASTSEVPDDYNNEATTEALINDNDKPSKASSSVKGSAPKFETKTTAKTTETKERSSKNKRPTDINEPDESHLEVIQLNSRNFGSYISDGNIWLIEFYSPDCSHCIDFAPSYADIAKQYHSTSYNQRQSKNNKNIKTATTKRKQRNIKVGKVNGEVERALVSRFGIEAYPSFYLIDGFNVYKFKELRLKKHLMSFAEGGYKKYVAMPFHTSPMGPLGIFQGVLISSGYICTDIFEWTHKTFGLSPLFVGIILFGIMFVGCFMTIVLFALIIPEKAKRD